MSKIVLITTLALVCTNASADWKIINRDFDQINYANPKTIRKTDNLVEMWSMTDYKNAQSDHDGFIYKSSKDLKEYDCIQLRTRFKSLIFFSENYGLGKVLNNTSSESNWTPVVPDSINEAYWSFACN